MKMAVGDNILGFLLLIVGVGVLYYCANRLLVKLKTEAHFNQEDAFEFSKATSVGIATGVIVIIIDRFFEKITEGSLFKPGEWLTNISTILWIVIFTLITMILVFFLLIQSFDGFKKENEIEANTIKRKKRSKHK